MQIAGPLVPRKCKTAIATIVLTACKMPAPSGDSDLASNTGRAQYVMCAANSSDPIVGRWSMSVSWKSDGSIERAAIGTNGFGATRANCEHPTTVSVSQWQTTPGGTAVITCKAQMDGKTYTGTLFKIDGENYGARIDNGTPKGLTQVKCGRAVIKQVKADCFDTIPRPNMVPTYAEIQQIVAKNCAGGCHSGRGADSGNRLSTARDLRANEEDIVLSLRGFLMPDGENQQTFCKSTDGIKLLQWLTYSKEGK